MISLLEQFNKQESILNDDDIIKNNTPHFNTSGYDICPDGYPAIQFYYYIVSYGTAIILIILLVSLVSIVSVRFDKDSTEWNTTTKKNPN